VISAQPDICSQCIILGHQSDPRVQGFLQALQQRGVNDASVIDYTADWSQPLPSLVKPDTLLRIESPGFDLAAIRQLMQRGNSQLEAEGLTPLSSREMTELTVENGAFIPPHAVYFGLRQRLFELQDLLADTSHISCMNHVPDILTFYDKQACHQQLAQHDIPQARPLYNIQSYDALRDAMQQQGLANVFIKTRYGSGASGIIALKTAGNKAGNAGRTGTKLHAYTTLEQADGSLHKGRLYNRRKLVTLTTESQLKPLVNQLCQWGVHCEAWLPKASIDGQRCDCRLVVVNGEPEFAVLRKSHTPMTNLHLLNDRADIATLRDIMDQQDWESLLNTARKLSAIFPKSFHFSPDIAVHQNKQRHSVLEVNAFGDYIRHCQVNGMNTYEWELEQWSKRNGTGGHS